MYIPSSFRETAPAKLFAFMERHSFAVLVSDADGVPFASHLPVLLDRSAGPHGCLYGHMARANPHWRHAAGKEVLVIFSGPHAYISPTWYESENVVPTWNYVAVHAYGTFHVLEEPVALAEALRDTVAVYEGGMPRPWDIDGQGDVVRRMMPAVTGFRIDLTRLEGKWKLGQNHPHERRERAIRALRGYTDADSRAVADLMEEAL
jgi:transcriptional regulator